jgi:hypothetical protein
MDEDILGPGQFRPRPPLNFETLAFALGFLLLWAYFYTEHMVYILATYFKADETCSVQLRDDLPSISLPLETDFKPKNIQN